mmetsp:Transcript_16132/g.17942  ORF Transcript_16132/g.17942 Transcript_16132/m.17942 type:complete len:155 (+) Transcript_16132:61-525(+)
MSSIEVFFANKKAEGPGYRTVAFTIPRKSTDRLEAIINSFISCANSKGFYFPLPKNRVIVTCNGYLKESTRPKDIPKICNYIIIFPRGYDTELVTNALSYLTTTEKRNKDKKRWLKKVPSTLISVPKRIMRTKTASNLHIRRKKMKKTQSRHIF